MSCQKDFLGGPDDSFSTFVGQERDEKLIALSLLSCMKDWIQKEITHKTMLIRDLKYF